MDYVNLPKTGLTLSSLGMGTVPITTRVETDKRADILRSVKDMGVNWFDTARAYGDGEAMLGQAFQGVRDEVVLISKAGGGDPEELEVDINETLTNLKSDYLDIFLFHGGWAMEQENFLAPGGTLEVAEKARQAGKIRFLGFSAHSVEVALLGTKTEWFDFAMVPANLISTQYIEGEFMTEARSRSIAVIAMKPFGGGRIKNARLCLKFLKRFPDVIPCVGIERADEMKENLECWEDGRELNENDRLEMERIRIELGDHFCRQCGYCEPCPQEIDIMMMNLMEAWASAFSKEWLASAGSGMIEQARKCTECRKCVERCPYDLPIPEMLKENIALFEKATQ